MSETPNHDDHWRRLAADLGLDVGPEPERPAPSAPAPEVAPDDSLFPESEPVAEAEPSGRGRRRRSSPPPDEAPARGFGEGLEPSEPDEPPPARGRRGRGGPPPER